MLPFVEARQKVIEAALALGPGPRRETVEFAAAAGAAPDHSSASASGYASACASACGRVLSSPIFADRDYPPFNRATRDGFAVRSAEATAGGVTLECIGEIKAGDAFERAVGPGECVQIMTGAAVPAGLDAVVMIEHVRVAGARVTLERALERGKNIVPRGQEARSGELLLDKGVRLGYAELALAAQVGQCRLDVWARPRVAILSTGDEVVQAQAAPGPLQIRNSNGVALETLVMLAGGMPVSLGNARDEARELRRRIEQGLESDILVLSGGVSMGKYDLVEAVLTELGAQIFFDSVAIRPGRPAVFGRCAGKLVFALPGNPLSTMVTFELFVAPAIEILGGAAAPGLPLVGARLTQAISESGDVTHFLPARMTGAVYEAGSVRGGGQEAATPDSRLGDRQIDRLSKEPEVTPLAWQGSGDTVAAAKANVYLVVSPEKTDWAPGEWATVMLRRGCDAVFSARRALQA